MKASREAFSKAPKPGGRAIKARAPGKPEARLSKTKSRWEAIRVVSLSGRLFKMSKIAWERRGGGAKTRLAPKGRGAEGRGGQSLESKGELDPPAASEAAKSQPRRRSPKSSKPLMGEGLSIAGKIGSLEAMKTLSGKGSGALSKSFTVISGE
jgi:hypothetical protein